MWIPNRSSLLHGAVRIAKVKSKLPLFDFILEMIDMGANTNLTDAENKTVFDIYAEQFMSFDFKKFGLKGSFYWIWRTIAVSHFLNFKWLHNCRTTDSINGRPFLELVQILQFIIARQQLGVSPFSPNLEKAGW